MTQRKTQKSAAPNTPHSSTQQTPDVLSHPRSWRRGLFALALKLSLVLFIVLACWGVYLDSKIQARFSGDLWQLPAAVYGRELNLYPQLRLTREELQKELELLNYRKVSRARLPGEFAVSKTRIEMVRRAFDFVDGQEAALPLLLTFSKTRLTQIQHRDTSESLNHVRLDPVLLDRLHIEDGEDRLFVPFADIPKSLVIALLMTEDRKFFEHDGVSLTAIARALVVNLQAGRTVQGGSTITQQLAKNLFLTSDRNLWRKIKEAYMALLIDMRYEKEEILETYLNEVYLGQNGKNSIHGIGLASYFYFGRPINSLGEDQQALLVALVKGPSYYDPWRHPVRATERRDLVLGLLAKEGLLAQEDYRQLIERPLDLAVRGTMGYQKVPGYTQLVKRELEERVLPNWRDGNGLKIFTTLDPASQRHVREATQRQLKSLETSEERDSLQAAVVVTERHTGAIRALISGKEEHFEGFNRALDARRDIGSLVKPFVYLTAYRAGYSPGQMLDDSPYALSVDGQRWEPQNYDKEFRGPVMLYQALAQSLNIPTVRLGMALGVDNVIHTLNQAGLERQVKPYPSVLLGSLSLTPMEVSQLYQTLAAEGDYQPLYSIEAILDGKGALVFEHQRQSERRWDAVSSYQILYNMMQVARVGTAKSLRWRIPKTTLAGKTGTTDDLRDAWFVGMDERQVVTVWVGRDDNKPAGVTGASGALPLYADYMKQQTPQSLHLATPNDMTWLNFSTHSGEVVAAGCPDTVLLPVPQALSQTQKGCFADKVRSFFGGT
jgi:penicillin-binding protein 1B